MGHSPDAAAVAAAAASAATASATAAASAAIGQAAHLRLSPLPHQIHSLGGQPSSDSVDLAGRTVVSAFIDFIFEIFKILAKMCHKLLILFV